MNILIIGTGNMARGISTRLLAGGHDVKLYNPDRTPAEKLADELGSASAGPGQVGVTTALGEAIAASEVVILTSWKAFNTTFAGTLLEGKVAGRTLDVFIAGDDEGARKTVAALVTSGGLNAVDVGGLERARQLEALGFLGIAMQSRLDTGFMTGWALVLPQAA